MASEYDTGVSEGFRQAGNNVAMSRALLSVGTKRILAFPLRLLEDCRGGLWRHRAVTELTPEQARKKCHQHLVLGLRLIPAEERVTVIAAAMQEVEARERRRHASDDGPRFLDS
jgi:hypothetical protein